MTAALQKNDILQGTLSLLVSGRSRRTSGCTGTPSPPTSSGSPDLLRVEEGSLYPALHRMEQAGWVQSEWGMTEKNREARFYALTARGSKRLELEQESWNRLTEGVGRVLRYA